MFNCSKFICETLSITSTALSNKFMSCLRASHASISGKKPGAADMLVEFHVSFMPHISSAWKVRGGMIGGLKGVIAIVMIVLWMLHLGELFQFDDGRIAERKPEYRRGMHVPDLLT